MRDQAVLLVVTELDYLILQYHKSHLVIFFFKSDAFDLQLCDIKSPVALKAFQLMNLMAVTSDMDPLY